MIPNIFISSTIEDLRYLRDALRDAILDLAYHPVMSEHGEVGYLHPTTAAESCYQSIQQCQMAVVIVGRRYGTPIEDGGISVTHQEFRTARDNAIPLIAFVEAQVLNYREVFKANPDPKTWKQFTHMDRPEMTFALIDEITDADTYNGLIPFTNVTEAKQALKLQVADFVGQSLTQAISPMRTEVREVLAEIKTLRHELSEQRKFDPEFFTTMRFILDERRGHYYRYLIENTLGPIDKAIPLIINSKTFEEFVKKIGYKLVVRDRIDIENYEKPPLKIISSMSYLAPFADGPKGMAKAQMVTLNDKTLVMNTAAKTHFEFTYKKLKMQT